MSAPVTDTCADCGHMIVPTPTALGGVIWTHEPIAAGTHAVPDDAVSTGTHWHPQHAVRRAVPVVLRGVHHLHQGEVYAEVRRAAELQREISDQAAVTIAAWWQAPSNKALTALASGAPTSADKIVREATCERAEMHSTDGPDGACLSALAEWALAYGGVSVGV